MKVKALTVSFALVCNIIASAQNAPQLPGQKVPAMKIYYVADEQAQMPVYAIRGPVGWELESTVQWNLRNTSVPVVIAAALTNPQGNEQLRFFPETTCYWLTGDAALNQPGEMRLGMLNVAPMEPKATLVEAVTKLYQADIAGLRITGVREVPGLAAALDRTGPNVTGVGLRAEFNLNGTKMEEEIYALHIISSATLRGEAGVTTQITWGLSHMHGFITPLGKLNERRSMFTYMVRSGQPNPAWVQLHLNVRQQLDAKFQQEIIDNRVARERIMAQSRALAAQNEAFRNNIMARHRAAMDTSAHDSFIAGIHADSPSSSGTGSSSQARYIDGIHDVETFNDPGTVTGTSQHGYAKQHWTDGWGNYIHSDNVNHDPNIGSTIQWQKMTPVE